MQRAHCIDQCAVSYAELLRRCAVPTVSAHGKNTTKPVTGLAFTMYTRIV